MSVSLRVTGTWAELTADGTVAIPATPQAGDRMYLFARWKDFSITATVANWTELVEFADGSVGSGNGTGSVKVGCWYRDWQSGDTDPTIDFSASPTNASVVIIVMAKDAADSWLTPVAVTAAMTNWTNTSQAVSASSTANVLGDGVVMGLIGLRDDSAVMTRPTNGIDDAGGLVTWNGNYVESPATHHSTTTGDDGAADLGYRLVTTGASGATLRMTGTISAAETGAALWIVQGVSTVVTPSATILAASQFAPLLLLAVGPASATLTTTGFTPQLRMAITPAASILSTTQFAPQLHTQITPSNASLIITSTIAQLQQALTPATTSLSLTAFVPVLSTSITPALITISLAAFIPAVTQATTLTIPNASFSLIPALPHVLPYPLNFLDPGGDAVQAVGYFNIEPPGSTGDVTFDNTEWVVGVGSYKFDSGASGLPAYLRAPGVLGVARRVSAYFWYDSLPDVVQSIVEFVPGAAVGYSGGGFAGDSNFQSDDGTYATATPAQNSGQGSVFSSPTLNLSPDSTITSVKIIYERKYDVNTSIGISRVKWRVNGEEGPDHDNMDMPLTDTVVEVDVTNDQFWEPQHLTQAAFEVIAEARRGDTAVEHTQSWDYVKVEVQYRPATTIMAAYEGSDIAFSVVLVPKGDHGVVRFTEGVRLDGSQFSYDGITKLLPDVKNRISFAYVVNGSDDLNVKVYVNSVEELSIENSATNGWDAGGNTDLYYGWIHTPGVSHVCRFDQIFIDDGDDLTDCGNVRCTAKLPAAVNENNWNTTGGTGAVNERPLNETNFRQETRAIQFRQTYTLEAASEGDVDLTGRTLVGYMGWAWARRGTGFNEDIALVLNGSDYLLTGGSNPTLSGTAALMAIPVASTLYPSNAAGIGMASNNETADTFMYECGVVVAYEGPGNPDILLPWQKVRDETLGTIVDDLRASPPDSYEVCCAFDDFDGSVQIVIHSLDQDGGSLQQQPGLDSRGRVRITPGVEVRLDVTVIGVTNLQIWRRINVD